MYPLSTASNEFVVNIFFYNLDIWFDADAVVPYFQIGILQACQVALILLSELIMAVWDHLISMINCWGYPGCHEMCLYIPYQEWKSNITVEWVTKQKH